jgi:hypothetical protein
VRSEFWHKIRDAVEAQHKELQDEYASSSGTSKSGAAIDQDMAARNADARNANSIIRAPTRQKTLRESSPEYTAWM